MFFRQRLGFFVANDLHLLGFIFPLEVSKLIKPEGVYIEFSV